MQVKRLDDFVLVKRFLSSYGPTKGNKEVKQIEEFKKLEELLDKFSSNFVKEYKHAYPKRERV